MAAHDNWTPVDSSFVKHYIRDGQHLTVKFHDGKVIKYKNVPEHHVTGFTSAASAGSYFKQHIAHKYDFEHVNDQLDTPYATGR